MNKAQLNSYSAILGGTRCVVMDIGARGTTDNPWIGLGDIIDLVLFEPDAEEANKLADNLNKTVTIIPKAVWSENGKFPLHITRNRSYCSLLKPDTEVLNGTIYYDRNFYEIDRIDTVETVSLDHCLEAYKLDQIDFMKIDVQGGELEVFKSLQDSKWKKVLGVFSEAYGARLYQAGTTIDEILSFLKSAELEPYHIENIANAPMTSWGEHELFSEEELGMRPNSAAYQGRQMVFDILLFKSFQTLLEQKQPEAIRRMSFLFAFHGYLDSALAIAHAGLEHGLLNSNELKEIRKALRNLRFGDMSMVRQIREVTAIKNYKFPRLQS